MVMFVFPVVVTGLVDGLVENGRVIECGSPGKFSAQSVRRSQLAATSPDRQRTWIR